MPAPRFTPEDGRPTRRLNLFSAVNGLKMGISLNNASAKKPPTGLGLLPGHWSQNAAELELR